MPGIKVSTMNYMAIEYAARHAWPSIEEKELPYGVLRFAHGYTKRANSMTLYSAYRLNARELVSQCEDFFCSRQQPAIVRISPFASMGRIDNYLSDCGYTIADPSRVMIAPLRIHRVPRVHVLQVSRQAWLDAFYEIGGVNSEQREKHESLLHTISGRTLFACLENDAGEPVCCAIGILFNDVLGIFNLATSPAFKRRQFATLMVDALLSWGRENQATYAFLQVNEINNAAISLYAKMGFGTFYHYWYRIKNNETGR